METTVIIALGSNRRHVRFGGPGLVLEAAVTALAVRGIHVLRRSRIHHTEPLGPSDRTFANAVITATTSLAPANLLSELKAVERAFGRRRSRKWSARVLDLDLIAYGECVVPSRHLWSQATGLVVPHRAMHLRSFVLDPLAEVAPDWRHPVLHRTARQLRESLRRPRSVD